jgi:RimJ/RimL family protein N-acetyltransferase
MATSPTDASRYSALETLRNGRTVEIRAINPQDRDEMLNVVGRASRDSFYRRFFSQKRDFSDREVDYYLDVDFVKQVALVAVLEEGGKSVIAGGGRYFVYKPGCAEIAFGLEDAYQGQGIASALMRHLVALAREAGLDELHADVLSGNLSMLKVFEKCGLAVSVKRDHDTVHVTIRLRDAVAGKPGCG